VKGGDNVSDERIERRVERERGGGTTPPMTNDCGIEEKK